MIDTDFLQKMSIFKGLDDKELDVVKEYFDVESYSAGDTIICDCEIGNKMYLLLEGEVEISKRLTLKVSQSDFDERDKQLIRLNADMNTFFGEMALFEDDSIRSASVITTEESRCAVITKENFEKLCKFDFKIGYVILHNIINVLCKRLNKANQDILKLTTAFSIALKSN